MLSSSQLSHYHLFSISIAMIFSLFLWPKKLFSMPIFQYSYCSERHFSIGQELRLWGLNELLHILKLVFFIRSFHYFHLAEILKYIAVIYFHLWNGIFLNHNPSESFRLSFLWSVTVSSVSESNFQSNSVIWKLQYGSHRKSPPSISQIYTTLQE